MRPACTTLTRRAIPVLWIGHLIGLLSIVPAAAQHMVLLGPLPAHAEEAKSWCGAATGQMVMEGYPTGPCAAGLVDPCTTDEAPPWTQTVVACEIDSQRVEGGWDADPAGLRGAMTRLCPLPPGGHWSIFQETDAANLMYWVAFWMTTNRFPVAALLDTQAHYPEVPAHQEHWVMIRGIRTDVDPTHSPSAAVHLQAVCITDPVGLTFGGPPIERCIDGATWYGELQTVGKPTSAYAGQYVAIIEPPLGPGRAIAPESARTGTLIGREAALRAVAALHDKNRCGEPAFRAGRWSEPLLINARYRGYYLVPFLGADGLAREAALVNAYDGSVEETGAFAPTRFLSEAEARAAALRSVGGQPKREALTDLVFDNRAGSPSRYQPTWRVRVDDRTVGVTQEGRVLPEVSGADASISIPARQATGLAISGRRLWTVDAGSREILELDAGSGALRRRFPISLRQPKGLAFDGTSLWIGDAAERQLHAFNPDTGQPVRTLPLTAPPEKGFRSLAALAWDGQSLWTAIAAGFSSSYNQIDRNSGRIQRSLFADCDPRGLAFDGGRLWSLCFNGDGNPPTLDRRDREGDEAARVRSRKLIRSLEGRSPDGLAFDGTALWYLDSRAGRVFRVSDDAAGGAAQKP